MYHQAGDAHLAELTLAAKTLITDPVLQERYYLEGTLSATKVNALLSAASVVITRAGSTTLFEIGLHGTPSIIIPIPEDVSRDQRSNAYAFARGGGATVIEEHNLSEALLVAEIQSIIGNSEHWRAMSEAAKQTVPRDAAEKIAASLIQIGLEHGS
jgi:UDP-N-acetylglucosamine--N-acetylmuramyl-(pentapeptide) pyrophosphoryl-undecaprenol N-acetylglucosamine transferase